MPEVTGIPVDVPISQCRHSRFNTRKSRTQEEIARLAERIARNGFERTRALWVTQAVDGMYEVFAGGTRLEAAKAAGLETVPVLLHSGLADDEISQRADLDNENDEYHTPVSPVDVWAEYARLRAEEGWTQERVASAKGVTQKTVSLRLKLHGLSDKIKQFIRQGDLTEGHLEEISRIYVDVYFSPWLTTEGAWEELAGKAVYDKGKNGDKSVRAVRRDVEQWKEFIAYARSVYDGLPDSITLHDLSGDEPKPIIYQPRDSFVSLLADDKARSLAKVKSAEHGVRTHIANNLAAYERFVMAESAAAARAAEKAEQERQLLARFYLGDCLEALDNWQDRPIRLLLTDPPYGMEYRSNRRWRTRAPDKIVGDNKEDAIGLLRMTIEAAIPHLADDAHVLVFCDAEHEPGVRQVLVGSGLTWKGQLIWKKEEHSAGDVRGTFAPRHECVVHAVKGSPEVTPRIDDVQEVPRSRETSHANEKPVELLKRLIESTTTKGDLVVDPFAGCASTLIAAKRMGRLFWGAEIDERYHDEGCGRLLREVK